MYKIKFTGQFKKELKLAKKQGKDINKLFKIVDILAEKKVLDIKYKDHALISNYKGFRECHIESDWLLIYKYYDDILVLSLSRLGSHSELF
ncbi:addiction module toxin, RelE/StbE family [Leptotrichia wadei]|uniref:Addiction module toxin, RelE/StbE family n=1 Tax=Leptotrichia wadei TaxID=157687 RepID=A0A134AMV5_9FUSO|nr:type II toxin-antitoxin system YafQ family toxin [Leptotrichia wadei]KXB69041.1 addiction module toxin, RelE/StbE family [Leptotrichia wadei]